MNPIVSRAAADAYRMFEEDRPDLRELVTPETVDGMTDLGQLLEALAAVDPALPGRLVTEGDVLGWHGLRADAAGPLPDAAGGAADRFVETGEGLEIEADRFVETGEGLEVESGSS